MLKVTERTKFIDLVAPKPLGEPINMHIVEVMEEPTPDFEKMLRTIQGTE